MRFLHVDDAEYLHGYSVKLRFNDGFEGVVDLSDSLTGPVFEPLRDNAFFKSFRIEGNTLSWENGADFAPEYLKEKAQQ